MTFGTNGVVDLRVGIDGRDPATIGNIQSNTPGEIFENLIILGSATGEGYMSPPGDIRAYDVLTGKLVWTFHTVPRPGEFGYDTWPKDAWKYIGGVNNWGEMTIDTAARHRLHPARFADLRLLRRRPHRRQPVRHVDRRARRAHRQAPVALPARAPRSLGHGPQRGAAADDHPPQRAQPRRRRRDQQDRLALRVRPRDRRADLADRGAAGAEERDAGRAELADAAASDQARRRTSSTRSRVDDISPYLPRRGGGGVQEAPARGRQQGHLHADQLRRTRCTCRRATAARCSAARRPSRAPAPSTSSRTTTRASSGCCVPAKGRGAAVRRSAAGPGRLPAELPDVPRRQPRRAPRPACRSCTRPPIRRTTSSPARRGSTRRRDPRRPRDRQGPHAARSRTSRATDVDNLVSFLTTPAGGRGRGRRSGRRARRGARRIRRAARTDRRIGIGVGAARTRRRRPRARRRCAVSGGHARLHALHDQRVQHRRQPHQAAVHDDREVRPERAGHQVADPVRRRSRRWPRAASPARARRRIHNGIIVTESGLVFGAGRRQSHPRLGQRHGQAAVVVDDSAATSPARR